MPSHLTNQQLSSLRRQLQQRLAVLREDIRQALLQSEDESYIELAGRVHDAEEESVADLLVDVNFAMIDLHVQEIRDIEAVLLRMDQGVYGLCTDCGTSIEYARLEAYPTAKRCFSCQRKHEQTYALAGHTKL